jgi:hypothetical protein
MHIVHIMAKHGTSWRRRMVHGKKAKAQKEQSQSYTKSTKRHKQLEHKTHHA